LPAAFADWHGIASFPRAARAGFATGMRQLNGWHRAVGFDKGRNARQPCHLFIFPKAQILRTDAAPRLDRGRFHHHNTGATHGAAAQVDKMPVIGKTIVRRILTHRRDHNPIARRDATQG